MVTGHQQGCGGEQGTGPAQLLREPHDGVQSILGRPPGLQSSFPLGASQGVDVGGQLAGRAVAVVQFFHAAVLPDAPVIISNKPIRHQTDDVAINKDSVRC
jgi:hypothetical protein